MTEPKPDHEQQASPEHPWTKADFDAHANDLEHLDVNDLVDVAITFFEEPEFKTPASGPTDEAAS